MPLGSGPLPDEFQLSQKAWNMMRGIDWNAMPIVCELLGINDVERLVNHLITIRDFKSD